MNARNCTPQTNTGYLGVFKYKDNQFQAIIVNWKVTLPHYLSHWASTAKAAHKWRQARAQEIYPKDFEYQTRIQ